MRDLFQLQLCEIDEWWEAERRRVDDACRRKAAQLCIWIDAEIDALDTMSLFLPRTAARAKLTKSITDRINGFNAAVSRTLRSRLVQSVARVGALDGDAPVDRELWALGGAGALLSTSSLAIAGSATALATSSTSLFFVVPAVAFSWPVFAATGVAALGAAVLGPRLLRRTEDRQREKLKGAMRAEVERLLIGRARQRAGKDGMSTRAALFEQIDLVRSQRHKDMPPC